MKDFLSSTSITSVIALCIIVLGFLLLFGVLFIPTTVDASTLTQIVSGDVTIMLLAAGYYFGASKQRSSAINAETVNTVNTGTEEKESK